MILTQVALDRLNDVIHGKGLFITKPLRSAVCRAVHAVGKLEEDLQSSEKLRRDLANEVTELRKELAVHEDTINSLMADKEELAKKLQLEKQTLNDAQTANEELAGEVARLKVDLSGAKFDVEHLATELTAEQKKTRAAMNRFERIRDLSSQP